MSTRSTAATRRKAAETTAYNLLADKVATVTALAEAGSEVDAAEERVSQARETHEAAQGRYAELYRPARAAGWSPSDLKAAGCDQDRAGAALRAPRNSRSRTPRGRSETATDMATTPRTTSSENAPSEASAPAGHDDTTSPGDSAVTA